MQTRPLIALLMAMTCAVAMSQNQATIAEANHAYYLGQYGRSLALYERLADAGDVEAAERAAFMLLLGDAVYGRDVRPDPARAKELLLQAARADRPGAGVMLNMLDGTD